MAKRTITYIAVILTTFLALLAVQRLLEDPAAYQERKAKKLEKAAEPMAHDPSATHIYGTAWGLTLASDGSGFYNELVQMVLGMFPKAPFYDIRPYRRAKALFYRDQESCLFPTNIKLLVDGGEVQGADGLTETDGFLHVKVFIFSKPGTEPPKTLEDVNGKSVAYAMGARIPYFLRNTRADFIAVADETDKARMLLSGRVDLMSAGMPDAKFVFDALGEKLPPFDPATQLNDTEVRIVCHDTPQNRMFVTAFNHELGSLLKAGALDRLLEKYGLEAALYTPAR